MFFYTMHNFYLPLFLYILLLLHNFIIFPSQFFLFPSPQFYYFVSSFPFLFSSTIIYFPSSVLNSLLLLYFIISPPCPHFILYIFYPRPHRPYTQLFLFPTHQHISFVFLHQHHHHHISTVFLHHHHHISIDFLLHHNLRIIHGLFIYFCCLFAAPQKGIILLTHHYSRDLCRRPKYNKQP